MITAILAGVALVLVILDLIPPVKGPFLQVAVLLLALALCLPILHLH